MDRQVEIGATYRHWGGNLYKVLGEEKIVNSFREGMAIKLDPYGFLICETALKKGDAAVVYREIDGAPQCIFIREKSNFLQVLGDEDEGTMYYRFEKVNTKGL